MWQRFGPTAEQEQQLASSRCVAAMQGGDACQLLPLQQGEALLLLLMGEDWAPSADARRSMAAAAAAPLQRLGAAVAAEIAAAHDGHVKGFR